MFVWNIYQIWLILLIYIIYFFITKNFFSNIYQIQLIYDVIVQHKEKFVWNIYTRYNFSLNIHDMFAMYTRWNIYTDQMKVKNYTSWNIETKPITLITYTSRCRKLHLKLSTLPTCSNGWNWGVAHCTKVWGPCYFSPLSGQDSLVPLELACEGET